MLIIPCASRDSTNSEDCLLLINDFQNLLCTNIILLQNFVQTGCDLLLVDEK
jgi:hypothetical protein